MRISLAHHWLISERGGEKVLKSFSALFPGVDLYALVAERKLDHFGDWLNRHKVHQSPLNLIPRAERHYKSLLPFFPLALRHLKVRKGTKLLLSSDASILKGLRVPKETVHVCYCHSPPRYLWEMQDAYLKQTSKLGWIGKTAFKAITPYVREFDRKAAQRVDHFIANSHFVAERIKRCYGRESTVIYPPVSYDDFHCEQKKEDFYLVVSELVPYKRIDIAVDAFNQNGKRLIIIGDGSEREYLKSIAQPNVEFVGRAPFQTLKEVYSKCRAFIFPGIEDFGITPLEAQASGSPVIAYGEGGALETMIDGETGLFFDSQTADALVEAVDHFEGMQFDPLACRRQAERFSEPRFRQEIKDFLVKVAPDVLEGYEWPAIDSSKHSVARGLTL